VVAVATRINKIISIRSVGFVDCQIMTMVPAYSPSDLVTGHDSDSMAPAERIERFRALLLQPGFDIPQVGEAMCLAFKMTAEERKCINLTVQAHTVNEFNSMRMIRGRFGIKLTIERFTDGQPFIEPLEQLEQIVDTIITKGAEVEGIFRLGASTEESKIIVKDICDGKQADISRVTPLSLANVIKRYTREVYPHLLTQEDIGRILAIEDASDYLASLPSRRRRFVGLLGRIARGLQSKVELNRMTITNLAIVFAPNFFQHPDPIVERDLNSPCRKVVELILLSA
jgi:hypothetical protein